MVSILVIDNYDSFVYTIVGYLNELGATTHVVRNDAVPHVADRATYDGILVSPGPGTPAAAGESMQVIRDCAATGTPMLGVCLGHQALGEVFGGTVTHAPELMHGKTSPVTHDGTGVFAGLPSLHSDPLPFPRRGQRDRLRRSCGHSPGGNRVRPHHHGITAPHTAVARGAVPPRISSH